MEEYYIIPKNTINDIEDSIQRKRGSDAPIEPSEMPLAIDTIPSSVDGTDVPVGGIYLTKPDSNGNPTECYVIGWAPIIGATFPINFLSPSQFLYIKKIEFIGTSNILTIPDSCFRNSSYLTEVTLPNDLQTIMGAAFRNCPSLTTINLPKSLFGVANNAFLECPSLQYVTIENGFNCNGLNLASSTLYSVETIVSWFNALADRTGQTSFTLTIGSTNLNKLTAEQKAIATNKNWTLA